MIRTSDDLSIANDTSTHTLEHQHHVLVSNRTSPQANPRMILLYRIYIDSHPNQTDRKILSDLWVESWDESMTWLQAFSQSRPCMEISDHEAHWPEVRSLHVCRVRTSCTCVRVCSSVWLSVGVWALVFERFSEDIYWVIASHYSFDWSSNNLLLTRESDRIEKRENTTYVTNFSRVLECLECGF